MGAKGIPCEAWLFTPAQSEAARSWRVRPTPALKRATKLWATLPRSPSVNGVTCTQSSGTATDALALQSVITFSKRVIAPAICAL